MDIINAGQAAASGTPLPIDGAGGLPQEFSMLFEGRTYFFRLYVNIPASRLPSRGTVLDLPTADAFLVVRVEVAESDGTRTPVFLRKVMPDFDYRAGAIFLSFPEQRFAIANLNGQGEFGTRIRGVIAPRWA